MQLKIYYPEVEELADAKVVDVEVADDMDIDLAVEEFVRQTEEKDPWREDWPTEVCVNIADKTLTYSIEPDWDVTMYVHRQKKEKKPCQS